MVAEPVVAEEEEMTEDDMWASPLSTADEFADTSVRVVDLLSEPVRTREEDAMDLLRGAALIASEDPRTAEGDDMSALLACTVS